MIQRNPQAAAGAHYDVIVVGGGIYGACVLLEAARRGLSGLLLERDDFGGATSWNSLRILHGGLRYLQTLDLVRFRQSVRGRHWFCRHFPGLVRPLACLMPLYGRGLKRPAAMRVALAINDRLSGDRNAGLAPEFRLPPGRVLTPSETIDMFPQVSRCGLQGGGLWYDAVMGNSQRILIEILRWACSLGATALNYVPATDLLSTHGAVAGVRACDRVRNQAYEYRSNVVVNCGGPWSRQIAATFGHDVPRLLRPSLAFNVLLNRPPLSQAALAVQQQTGGSQMYFVCPWQGRTVAGTVHRPWSDSVSKHCPSEQQIEELLTELNRALPDCGLVRSDVLRTYSGLLPAAKQGTARLTKRPVVHDHHSAGGPRGLISVSGIKFTTAPVVAERALCLGNSAWPRMRYRDDSDGPRKCEVLDEQQLFASDDGALRERLCRMVREESVVQWDDLVYRRNDWAQDPQREGRVRERVEQLIDLGGFAEESLERDQPAVQR